MNSLNAVSPIDGRYRGKCEPLAAYFSEGALIKYRVRVEVEYFIALADKLKGLRPQLAGVAAKAEELRNIYRNFTDTDAQAIKDIEKVTNHDVKAVEYFLKGKFDEMGLQEFKEFIHFGLKNATTRCCCQPTAVCWPCSTRRRRSGKTYRCWRIHTASQPRPRR